ncbi:hypothetical protein DIPPA_25132 [Diplonema papillatum]|nr:hypothetical protein DIPPA_25132 [Diplonema papillatum]
MNEPPKRWVALSRRAEGEPPLDCLADLCFERLVARDGAPSENITLPHTIVFREGGYTKWYFTSESLGIQQKKPSQVTTAAIKRAFALATAPEGPVAVWHSERKDSKGYLYTQEFFSERDLSDFLKFRTDRARCGVLQKFVLPKDVKGKEGVNHELLVSCDAKGDLLIERRFNNHPLSPCKALPETLQGCVHPAVSVVGRLQPPPGAITAPFQPNDVKVGFDVMTSPALLAVLAPIMKRIAGRICCPADSLLAWTAPSPAPGQPNNDGAAVSTGQSPVPVSPFPCAAREAAAVFKVDRRNQLWLLGVAAVKCGNDGGISAGDEGKPLRPAVPNFELLKARKRKGTLDNVEGNALDFDFALTSEVTVPQVEDAEPAPARRAKAAAKPPPDASVFRCPNCGDDVPRDDVHLTTVHSIVRFVDNRARQQKKWLYSAAEQASACPGQSASPPPLFPASPPRGSFAAAALDGGSFYDRTCSQLTGSPRNATVGFSDNPELSVLFDSSHLWATVPPVLERLSRNLAELKTKPHWLNRQVLLCKGCYLLFFDAGHERAQLRTCLKREREAALAYGDRKTAAAGISLHQGCKADDAAFPLVDALVFTDLQQVHREAQLGTKQKAEKRLALFGGGGGGAFPPLHHVAFTAGRPSDAGERSMLRSDTWGAGPGWGAVDTRRPHTAPGLGVGPRGSAVGGKVYQPVPPSRILPAGGRPPGYARVQFGPIANPITSAALAVAKAKGGGAAVVEGAPLPVAVRPSPLDASRRVTIRESTAFTRVDTALPGGPSDPNDYLRLLEPGDASCTELESTVSTILCNKLYEELTAALAYGVECPTGDDVAADHVLYNVYGNNRNRIPPPEPRIELALSASDEQLAAEREKGSAVARHRQKAHAQIAGVLPLFGALSEAEKELLVGVVEGLHAREKEKVKQDVLKKKKTDAPAEKPAGDQEQT